MCGNKYCFSVVYRFSELKNNPEKYIKANEAVRNGEVNCARMLFYCFGI